MSISRILYYPSIEPNPIWLRGPLLLFDKVYRIVPKDYDESPNEQLLTMMEAFPNSIDKVVPNNIDINMNHNELDRLETAFQIISDNKPQKTEQKIIIHRNGNMSIEGYDAIHVRKTTKRVRGLLDQYKLISPIPKRIEKSGLSFDDDWLITVPQASDLIMSNLAGKIAKRRNLSMISDQEMDFTFLSLNQKGINEIPSGMSANGKLASAMFDIVVPEETYTLDLKKYKKIREKYSDFRDVFNQTLSDYELEKIDDVDYLNKTIEDIVNTFKVELEKIQKSTFGRQFKRWTPLSIGTLLSFASLATLQPEIAITVESASIGIQTIKEIYSFYSRPDKNMYNMIHKMKKDIIRADFVQRLI